MDAAQQPLQTLPLTTAPDTRPGCHTRLDWRIRHFKQPACNPVKSKHFVNLSTDVLPSVWHVVQYQLPLSSFGQADARVNLVHLNPSAGVLKSADYLYQALDNLSGSHEVWAPVSSNHTFLLHCLRLVSAKSTSLDLSDLTLIYVGDHGNASAFESLSQQWNMHFCFQAAL